MKVNAPLAITLILLIGACNPTDDNIPSPVPVSDTPAPPTATITPLPPTATFTPSHTPTPSTTPTATATAVDPILAESGYDVAAFRVFYPREDIMQVDFEYRLMEGDYRLLGDYKVAFVLVLPAACRDGSRNTLRQYPYSEVEQQTGSVSIIFKLQIEGECSFDSFHINIVPEQDLDRCIVPCNFSAPILYLYSEKVLLPFSIVRNFPTINTDVVSFSNFRFEQTGTWSGNVLIDYEISEEIPLEQEEYFFAMLGSGGGGACRFQSQGEIIKEYAGTYVISITLPRDLTIAGCTDGFTSYLFDTFVLWVVDAYNFDTLIFHTPVLEAMFED